MNMNDLVFIGTSIFLYEDLIESFLPPNQIQTVHVNE